MNSKEIQFKLRKLKDDFQKNITERGITALQLLLFQQLICNLLLVCTTPVHNIKLNLQRLGDSLQNSQMSANDFVLVTNLLKTRAIFPNVFEFRNVIIILGFALTLFSFLNSKKSSSSRINKTASTITSVVFVWILFSFNVFLPLRESLVVEFHGLPTVINHPINSIGLVIVTVLSLPFSIVAKSPINSSESDLKFIVDQITKATEGRISLSAESLHQVQDFYTLTYNWSLILPLLFFVVAYVMLLADQRKEEEMRFENRRHEDVITKGKVQMLSKTFESKTINNNNSKQRKAINLPISEAEIKPVQCNPLMQSKVKPPTALVKIRPVNITKPLNVNTDSPSHSPVTVVKPFPAVAVNQGSPNSHQSSIKPFPAVAVNQDAPNSHQSSIKPFPAVVKQDSLSGPHQPLVKPFIVKVDIHTQTINEIDYQSLMVKTEKMRKVDSTIIDHFTQTDPLNAIKKHDFGVCFRSSTQHSSQQTSVEITDSFSQTKITKTTESSQQCDVNSVKDQHQQTSIETTNLGTQCELLSQERFSKLQKSALSLYKKTIEKQDYVYSTFPRKLNVESKITKYNKSIQVDLKLSEDDIIVNGHLSPKKTPIPAIATDDVDYATTVETQTDLFGYVLDKIIQERESGNVYSKLDLEKTVHSTISMSEQIKQHTESIRFKAMKSQHGVWYVSLRGDIFLTVAQSILKNIKMNQELKIETEVSSDILRAMKTFIDNYNKLSDCFEDDIESADESFINGFRL